MTKEDLLFGIYKDTAYERRLPKALRAKYPDVDVTEVTRRITNYQIDKYGTTLTERFEHLIDWTDAGEANNAYSISKYQKNGRKEDTNAKIERIYKRNQKTQTTKK